MSLVSCPYDSSHMILESRLQFHIVRCKKNFPAKNKVVCPYNTVHIVDAIQLKSHLLQCPNAREVQAFSVQLEEKELPGIASMEQVKGVEDTTMMGFENWDNEVQAFSYNGFEECANRPVVRTLIGASKAKRREFREQERRRIAMISQKKSPKNNQPLPQLRTPCTSKQRSEVEDDKPLKLPSDKTLKKLPPKATPVNETTSTNTREQIEPEKNCSSDDEIEEQLKRLELQKLKLEAKKASKAATKRAEAESGAQASGTQKAAQQPKVGRCAANFDLA